jgi:hypothetical protein
MTNVYFTWFGPPAAANKHVEGIGQVRPDLFGLLRLANATFPPNHQPSFTLYCLANHLAAFRAAVPQPIQVQAIEQQFASHNYKSLVDIIPGRTASLETQVDFIIREMLSSHGDRGRGGAFMKDIWSLYCIWKFGGYHLDCGCFPDNANLAVNLPAPTTFGTVANQQSGVTQYVHCSVDFPSGVTCAALSRGNRVFEVAVLAGMTQPQRLPCRLQRNIDVWLMRSPAGDPAAKVALEFYVKGWFEIRGARLSEALHAQALRELIISAVATGVTHSGPGRRFGQGCVGYACEDHLIDATISPGRVAAFNIRKVGFASHH